MHLKIQQPSLRVLFDANRESTADIKVLFKILRTDDASGFDELDFKFFNDDGTVTGSGGPDLKCEPLSVLNQFNEYEFTAGVTDDGIGTHLMSSLLSRLRLSCGQQTLQDHQGLKTLEF